MHIPPWGTCAQYPKHIVKKPPVIIRNTAPLSFFTQADEGPTMPKQSLKYHAGSVDFSCSLLAAEMLLYTTIFVSTQDMESRPAIKMRSSR